MIDDLTLQDELNQPTINVPRAALRIARTIAYPILDVDFYINRLNLLAQSASPRVAGGKTLEEKIDELSDFLFQEMKFHGNRNNYYDPCNSYINCVMDRKLGIPISLGTIYIAVAQRLGLNAYGIGLPGHFIVGMYQGGTQILIDPFNAGSRLSVADCARLVRKNTGIKSEFDRNWLSPITPNDLLARILTNLCHAYIQREEWQSAIPVVQHLLIVQPRANFHLRDLGYLCLYNGSLRLSAQYLEEYLRRSPSASDYENVRSSLKIVGGRLALWN